MDRLKAIIRHITNVQRDTQILGDALIAGGREGLGRELVGRGLRHDASKLSGIEWAYLGGDDPDLHREAWGHHVRHNDHHPEYWGGIALMREDALAEMVCDWHARSSEFGSGLLEWIDNEAAARFGFARGDAVRLRIEEFLGMLLEKRFA